MLQTRSARTLIIVGALMSALAGIIHLWLAPIHWYHSPAHGIFFMAAGVMQILWANFLWRSPSNRLYLLGAIMSGWLIVLYLLTRWFRAPFHDGPEAFGAIDLACKACELLAMISVAILIFQSLMLSSGTGAARRAVLVVILGSVLAGYLTYGLALAAEPIFPQWMPPAETEHHHDDGLPDVHTE